MWTAVATIQAMYAPADDPSRRAAAPHAADAGAEALHRAAGTGAEALHRAADHGDEHVIKFTDTAVDAVEICGDPDLLAAAGLARELIPRP